MRGSNPKCQEFRGSNGDGRVWSRGTQRHKGLHKIYSWKVSIKEVLRRSVLFISDPRVYAIKQSNPDIPSFNEAVNGEFSRQYVEAKKKRISALIHQNIWIIAPRSEADNVIKLNWAFKLKRIPDGTPSMFRTRCCVRGDHQKEGVD